MKFSAATVFFFVFCTTTFAQEGSTPEELLKNKNTDYVVNYFPREARGDNEFKFGWSALVTILCDQDPRLPWTIVITMVPMKGALKSGNVLWVERGLLEIVARTNAGPTTIRWDTKLKKFVLTTTENEKKKIEDAIAKASAHHH